VPIPAVTRASGSARRLCGALRDAIESAYDRLVAREGVQPHPPLLAVRSSAVGEDSHLSFAGQFTTVLNVARQGLGDAYVQVASSLYSPEAVHYRMFHKIPGESAQMAVGFVSMVDAVSSGVVFTRDPGHPDSGHILIQAVHGLGVTLVDGRAVAEQILLTRGREPSLISRTIAHQSSQVVMSPDAGLREERCPRRRIYLSASVSKRLCNSHAGRSCWKITSAARRTSSGPSMLAATWCSCSRDLCAYRLHRRAARNHARGFPCCWPEAKWLARASVWGRLYTWTRVATSMRFPKAVCWSPADPRPASSA